ncbi:uncharacterized protein LOC131163909 [Malania oleifera]|uniref:uncharacterized protein LOC131163909 n=1 Tax=Malania oleifera TaxID=397392 RepID=UPI0025ADF844|nr:uncharacterized protein LOC131163909 [Malania oleifera]
MHEYRINDELTNKIERHSNDTRLDDWVLCKIYEKGGRTSGRTEEEDDQEDDEMKQMEPNEPTNASAITDYGTASTASAITDHGTASTSANDTILDDSFVDAFDFDFDFDDSILDHNFDDIPGDVLTAPTIIDDRKGPNDQFFAPSYHHEPLGEAPFDDGIHNNSSCSYAANYNISGNMGIPRMEAEPNSVEQMLTEVMSRSRARSIQKQRLQQEIWNIARLEKQLDDSNLLHFHASTFKF